MNLFEEETVNISKIHTVELFESTTLSGGKTVRKYPVNLPVYELVFFISGEHKTVFSGAKMSDTPNSVRYMPKGIEAGEYVVETLTSGKCIDIYFDTADKLPDVAMSLKDMNELKPLYEKIYNVWQSKKPGYYAKAMSVLYDIIYALKKHNENYLISEQKRKIMPAFDYMLEHFCDRNFNYREMCSKSGLSYDYFKDLFIKQHGVSPVKFVTSMRIEKAKELLITGQYSISEIARMCGFDSLYYFSDVFKKHTGVAPSKYKIL